MKPLMTVGLLGLLCSPVLHAAKAEFIAIQVPPGKAASDLKPRVGARADQPIVLELRAHRHPDGSLQWQCDEHLLPSKDETAAAGDSE